MTYEKIKGKRMWRICLPSIGDKYLPVQIVFRLSKQNNNFLFLMGCSLCIKTNFNFKRLYLLVYDVHAFWLPTHRLMCRYITLNMMEPWSFNYNNLIIIWTKCKKYIYVSVVYPGRG